LAFLVYMRVSQVCLSAAVFIAALWPWQTAPGVVRFMSKHSLALYVLHAFFRPLVLQNTPALGLPDAAVRLVQLVVVVLLCYLASLVMVAFLKDDLLR
jgi:hypothetical protein